MVLVIVASANVYETQFNRSVAGHPGNGVPLAGCAAKGVAWASDWPIQGRFPCTQNPKTLRGEPQTQPRYTFLYNHITRQLEVVTTGLQTFSLTLIFSVVLAVVFAVGIAITRVEK